MPGEKGRGCLLFQLTNLYTNYSFTATETATGAGVEMAALQKAPFSVIRAGMYILETGTIEARSYAGRYWTFSTSALMLAANLNFNGSDFRPQSGNSKAHGFTVRCVVR